MKRIIGAVTLSLVAWVAWVAVRWTAEFRRDLAEARLIERSRYGDDMA